MLGGDEIGKIGSESLVEEGPVSAEGAAAIREGTFFNNASLIKKRQTLMAETKPSIMREIEAEEEEEN